MHGCWLFHGKHIILKSQNNAKQVPIGTLKLKPIKQYDMYYVYTKHILYTARTHSVYQSMWTKNQPTYTRLTKIIKCLLHAYQKRSLGLAILRSSAMLNWRHTLQAWILDVCCCCLFMYEQQCLYIIFIFNFI